MWGTTGTGCKDVHSSTSCNGVLSFLFAFSVGSVSSIDWSSKSRVIGGVSFSFLFAFSSSWGTNGDKVGVSLSSVTPAMGAR